MLNLNYAVRRVFAWPALTIGFALTCVGGVLIRFAAWTMDISVEEGA